jgi:phosphohistidine phosphatase
LRSLILLRHAEPARRYSGVDDHARELTPRGIEDARELARHLLEMGQIPERVLCSTARRTRQTWLRLEDVWSTVGHFPVLRFDDALYLASAERILDEVRLVDAACEHLMVLGHNPGIHHLAVELAREDVTDVRPLERLREGMTPGTAVVLDFEKPTWLDVTWHTGVAVDVVRPADLRSES